MNYSPGHRGLVSTIVFLSFLTCGCFSERAFPMRPGDLVIVDYPPKADTREPNTRQWLTRTHGQLCRLLPSHRPSALITEDLVDNNGKPANVWKHFRRNPKTLELLFGNREGLLNTAQASGGDFDPLSPPPPWPDYEQIWIPVDEKLSLAGRFALAKRDNEAIDADCIVLLPGILGHNAIARTKDIADALVSSGLHVLALELRGHGQTDLRYPNIPYTFGPRETTDLLRVSEWLQDQPHIRRTGLIGFCWGANHAMIAAWYEGLSGPHEGISPTLAPYMHEVSSRPHYEAGIIAFSPVLRFEEIIEDVKRPRSKVIHPLLATLQETIAARSRAKGYPHLKGCLRTLIRDELSRSELDYPESVDDTICLSRLLPYKGLSDGDKLSHARMPVLIVQGVDDPLALAQDVADLMTQLDNPNVAAVILPGGGHVGFAPYARSYFYSLLINFFRSGPGAVTFVP